MFLEAGPFTCVSLTVLRFSWGADICEEEKQKHMGGSFQATAGFQEVRSLSESNNSCVNMHC